MHAHCLTVQAEAILGFPDLKTSLLTLITAKVEPCASAFPKWQGPASSSQVAIFKDCGLSVLNLTSQNTKKVSVSFLECTKIFLAFPKDEKTI